MSVVHTQRALVTGASEGIGRAFAERLAGFGFSVTAVARNRERLTELIDTLPGESHRFLEADLATEDGLKCVTGEILTNEYQIVINNAGAAQFGAFHEQSPENILALHKLNVDAVLGISHAFLRHAKEGDALLNVASTLAFMPMSNLATYCASKSYIVTLSETLWAEQRGRGVYVGVLCPGWTGTRFHRVSGSPQYKMPTAMKLTVEQVVDLGMHTLMRRKDPVVVTGWVNRLVVVFASRLLGRKLRLRLLSNSNQQPDAIRQKN